MLKPLAHRRPEATSRELPGGRGFLRVVKPGCGPVAPTSPVFPPTPVVPAKVRPVQLELFGNEPEQPS